MRKVVHMSSFSRAVLPHLVNIETTGLGVDEVRVRLEAAGAHVAACPGAA